MFFLGMDELLVDLLAAFGVGDGGDFGNSAILVLFLNTGEDPLVFEFFLEGGKVHGNNRIGSNRTRITSNN